MSTEIREDVAAYAHALWSGWMVHLFSRAHEHSDGTVRIQPGQVFQLRRRMRATYAELTEDEREALREEAARLLRIFHEAQR